MVAGAVVVLGHAFPVFLKFRGGKGGASSIGVLAALMPMGLPFYVGLVAIVLLITRFLTLSYGVAFVSFPFAAWLIYHSWEMIVFSVVLLLIPGLKYIPRAMQMRSSGGSWRRVVFRSSMKDRL
jgi:glycerol-3-phosphate acyltransferase PlsY